MKTTLASLSLSLRKQSEKQQHIPHSHVDSVVTNKVVRLFLEIGVEPTDWFVSLYELTQRNLQQAQKEIFHIWQREMDSAFHNKGNLFW